MFKVKHKLTGEVVTVYSASGTSTKATKFLVFKEDAFSGNGVWMWVVASQYEPLAGKAEVADLQPGTLGGDLGWF